MRTLAAVAALIATSPAFAQDRPSEDELFGAPAQAAPPADPAAEPVAPPPGTGPAEKGGAEGEGARTPPQTSDARDEAILGDRDRATRLSAETAPDDPLKIGGQFYLRANAMALDGQSPDDWSFSSPSLLDAYFDARPNERVRGFVLARMAFDPTLPDNVDPNAMVMAPGGMEASGSTMGTEPLSALFSRRTRGPRVALDQLWLRFDVGRRVFVTAGKQHVRWGTARFWTPTDFLHVRRRNPLDVFDARTGTTMLKLHIPWEARGWNFYAYALAEGAEATPTVGDIAGAGRAEIVLGTTELGLGALVQGGRKPKLAADVSTGIWIFDLYGEIALRYGSEIDRVTYRRFTPADPSAAPPATAGDLEPLVEMVYPRSRDAGVKPQVTGGVTYQVQYADRDVLTFGGEYFYNSLGYDDTAVYPGLLFPRSRPLEEPATFFYLGRHYAALFAMAPAPGSWDNTTFILSGLVNASDGSGIARLDYNVLVLTHLRFEAFAAVRLGEDEGEFRFGIPLVGRKPGFVDLGVALRVGL